MASPQTNFRRATSAGYRLPDRPVAAVTSNSSVSVSRQKSRAVSSGNKSQSAVDPDYKDPVKQDQVWREFVHAELEGARQWQKNWSFLKNYDQLGRLREEKALPTYVTVFSDKVPNTMNQTFGSRMNTDIGQALIHMDSILLRGNRKKKLSQDMLPC